MKRIICACLVICLIFGSLCACGESKSGTKDNKDGSVITTAEELFALAEKKDGDYTIGANIDLGGKEWKPFDFSGSLSGVWGGIFNYTISNFKIKAEKDDKAVGFFKTLDGKLENLNFENVTLEFSDGFSGAAGTAAGICKSELKGIKIYGSKFTGKVKDATVGTVVGKTEEAVDSCYADGTIDLTTDGKTFIGGIAGDLTDCVSTESRTIIKALANSGSADIGGIGGNAIIIDKSRFGGTLSVDAKGETAARVAQFAGSISGSISTSYANCRDVNVTGNNAKYGDFFANERETYPVNDCVKRDLSNLEENTITEKEYKLRKTVVDYMKAETSIAWTPSKDMTFTDDHPTHRQEYSKGEWYFGLPYTHKCGSLEKMQNYLNEDGSVKNNIAATGWGGLMGNDCADAIFWALQRVSASPSYTLTDGMICENGMIAVGKYEVVKNSKNKNSTKETCQKNGEKVMYEAYAKIKLGDAVVKGPEGHTRLAAENAYVYRNSDGSINGEKSYIITHEQGARVSTMPDYHTTCKVNGRNTFATLFEKDYVPVTIPEYEKGEKTPVELSIDSKTDIKTLTDLSKATVTSNYRINFVTLTLKSDKETVYNKTVYPSYGTHNLYYQLGSMLTANEIKNIKSGEFTAIISVNGTDAEHTLKEIKVKK